MAKTGLDTGDTVNELKKLVSEFVSLQKQSKNAAKSFTELQNALAGLGGVATKTDAEFEKLSTKLKNTQKSQKSYVTQTKNLKQANAELRAEIQSLLAALDLQEQKHKKVVSGLKKKKKALTEAEKVTKALKVASEKLAVANSKEYAELIKTRQALADRNKEIRESVKVKKQAKTALTEEEKLSRRLAVAKERLALASSKEYKQLIKTQQALNKKTAALRGNTKATKRATSGMRGLFSATKNLLSAFGIIAGIQLFVNIGKNIYKLMKDFDGLNFALERVTGSMVLAEESSRFLLDISEKFGAELVKTTERWIKFRAAAKNSGLSLKDTQKIFKSMTKAAGVLGLKTDELQGIYLALEQMLSKGKVTTEELRRQLGERLPGAMGIMAAAIGKTIPELDAMMKKGEVLSAEVLPKFADAVEVAFGIETLEKVDTLVAAENRMTTAWQNFVKNVFTESSGLIRVFNSIADAVNDIGVNLGGSDAIRKEAFKDQTTVVENNFIKRHELYVEQLNNDLGAFERHRKKLAELKDKATKADVKKQEAAGNYQNSEEIARETKLLLDLAKLRDASIKKEALEQVEVFEEQFFKQKEDLEKLVKFEGLDEQKLASNLFQYGQLGFIADYFDKLDPDDIKKIDKAFKESVFYDESSATLGNTIRDWESFEKVLKEVSKITGETQGEYMFRLTQIGESKPVDPLLPDGDDAKTQRLLKKIIDKHEELEKAKLELRIAGNKALAKTDLVNNSERLFMIDENAQSEARIRELNYKIAERDAKNYFENQKASLEKSVAEKKLSKSKADAQIADLEHQLQDKLTQAQIAGERERLANAQSTSKAREAVVEAMNKIIVDETTAYYDEQIASVKKLLDAENLSASKRKKLTEDLADLKYDQANAVIDANIMILESELDTLAMMGTLGYHVEEKMQDIERAIAGLEASRPDKKTFNKDDLIETISGWMDIARDALSAINDIVQANFDRKIEMIDAELDANEKKYDALIRMAEGDDEQQATLERNKLLRQRKLEREKLLIEQKAAKSRKAFATADVAISTAQSIMKAWVTPGYPGAIALTAVLAALGVAQIAAIQAQPIPQYKDGLDNATSDHVAMINDGGKQEYIERNGEIFTTSTKNAVVNIQKGDTVHKDYDSMVKRSVMLNVLSNGMSVKENDFLVLSETISSGINKGFKKAKINNKININQTSTDDSYGDSLSRWQS